MIEVYCPDCDILEYRLEFEAGLRCPKCKQYFLYELLNEE